ncbi:MAG TPA: DUF4331 family protein [Kofleriaceae bacterium]
MADIEDVYAWMTGFTLDLVMDVSPLDDGSHRFDRSVQYVFHVNSKTGTNGLATTSTTTAETRIIVQFDSGTQVQVWVVDPAGAVKDYIQGDPSATAGVSSVAGKTRIFAGRRSDPRFFSQSGLTAGLTQLGTFQTTNGMGRDASGCPNNIAGGDTTLIRQALTGGADTYAGKNVMAIVVTLDKSLVNAPGNTNIAVWGSTHQGQGS